jgi:hypothetical protein
MSSPKKLGDLSHLFLSTAKGKKKDEPPAHVSSPSAFHDPHPLKHAAGQSLDPDLLKRLLDRPGAVRFDFGAVRLVDGNVVEPDGVDAILCDDAGNPVLLEILQGNTETIPYRIFHHLDWLQGRSRLFLRAYLHSGILQADDPLFIFLAPSFPAVVIRAVGLIESVRVRLITARTGRIAGAPGLLLRDVPPNSSGTVSSIFLPISSA